LKIKYSILSTTGFPVPFYSFALLSFIYRCPQLLLMMRRGSCDFPLNAFGFHLDCVGLRGSSSNTPHPSVFPTRRLASCNASTKKQLINQSIGEYAISSSESFVDDDKGFHLRLPQSISAF